jgi:hypothetical protein
MLVRLFKKAKALRVSGLAYKQASAERFLTEYMVQAAPDIIVGLLGVPIAFAFQNFLDASNGDTVGLIPARPVCFLVYALFLLACYFFFSVVLLEILDAWKTGAGSRLDHTRWLFFTIATVFSFVLLSATDDFEWIRRITVIPMFALAVEELPRMLGSQKGREGGKQFTVSMSTVCLLWIIAGWFPPL